MRERVLAVPKKYLFPTEEDYFHGFLAGCKQRLWDQMSHHANFISREIVEGNHRYKQLIPYAIIRYQNSIFCYRRIGDTAEKRLLQCRSLGVGGHVNPSPASSFGELLRRNLNREIREEVALKKPYSYRFLGLLNDESNDVGRDHLGLVYLISSASPKITVREKKKLSGNLLPVAEIAQYHDELESWSLLLLNQVDQIFPKVVQPLLEG